MKRFESDEGIRLGNIISLRPRQGRKSMVLWIGNGCSSGAGIPSWDTALANLAIRLKRKTLTSDQLADLDPDDIGLLVRQEIVGSDSTLGHVLLAELCASRYFQIVITVNWDNLVEDSLRRVLPARRIRVFTRPDNPDDLIARQLGDLPEDTVVLLKLHGSLASRMFMATGDLVRFEEPLKARLIEIINDRGILFAGYNCSEPGLEDLCNGKTPNGHAWVAKRSALKPEIATRLGITPPHCLVAPDGEFESLMQGLAACCLEEALKGRTLHDGYQSATQSQSRLWRQDFAQHGTKIAKIVKDVSDWLVGAQVSFEEARTGAAGIADAVANHLKLHHIDPSNACVFFVDNSRSPGGSEIRDIIERDFDMKACLERVEQIRIHLTERSADQIPDEINDEVTIRVTTDRLIDPARFSQIAACVLIDDVSFTGATLLRVREWALRNGLPKGCKFTSALLRVTEKARSALKRERCPVIYGQSNEGVGLITPWGYIRPTTHVLYDSPLTPNLDAPSPSVTAEDFKPRPGIGLIPKPWGEVHVIQDNSNMSTRVLIVGRGERTSLHYHLIRDETFYVLDDRIRFSLWDKSIELRRYQSIRIPRGVPHALVAIDTPCRVVEVSEGFCDAKFDIVRLVDIHGRPQGPDGEDGLL